MKKASNTNMTGNGLIGAWTPLVGSVNLHTTAFAGKIESVCPLPTSYSFIPT